MKIRGGLVIQARTSVQAPVGVSLNRLAHGKRVPMRYAIVFERAGENYSAYVPDLPGCIAAADTLALEASRALEHEQGESQAVG